MHILLLIVFSFIVGFLFGASKRETETNIQKSTTDIYLKANDNPTTLLDIDLDKAPVWGIVRYRDGQFDCIWSRGHTKREAEKKCKKLNSDYHKDYGEYSVENMTYYDAK